MFTKATRDLIHVLAQRMGGTFHDPKYSAEHRKERDNAILKKFIVDHIDQFDDFPPWIRDYCRTWGIDGHQGHASHSAGESTLPPASRTEVEASPVWID